MELHERVFEISLTRLIFYPSNEPYGAIAGFYDYGPIGIRIKRNIEKLWREIFIESEGHLEVQSTIVTPESVLEASGHVAEFTDPITECQQCHFKFRADKLIEQKFNMEWQGDWNELKEKLAEMKCPRCGGKLGEPYKVNLMFNTEIGYDGNKAYLRPETAQGIFTAFPRLFKLAGAQLPMAVGQIGKSFRNEISPRRGLVRLREFTQAELEYFMDPENQKHSKLKDVENIEFNFKHRGSSEVVKETAKSLVEKGVCSEVFAYFLAKEWIFFKTLGLKEDKMWLRHLRDDETPHYSGGNVDMEVETSYGIIEIAGNAYRTNHDLGQHFKKTNDKGFKVKLEGKDEPIIPHVFEVSIGIDRTLFVMLEHSFEEKGKKEEGKKGWAWFRFSTAVAPYDALVGPLLSNDEKLVEKAKVVFEKLRMESLDVLYKEKGSIGKRYAKADEIGVPYAITIDHQSLEDNTATIRFRDSGEQERVAIDELAEKLKEYIGKGRTA